MTIVQEIRRTPLWIQAVVTCLAALIFGPTAGNAVDDPKRIEIYAPLIGMRFDPTRFTVEPGQEVELVFSTDPGGMVHNLLIVEPGALEEVANMALDLGREGMARHWVPETDKVLFHTRLLAPGESETLRFTAPETEGIYPYVCTIPGHAISMRGQMQVTWDVGEQTGQASVNDSPGPAERYQAMDTGPFYSGVIDLPGIGTLDKGLTIRVGDQRQATVHFDTDLLRMSAGWSGDFLAFHSEHDAGIRNSPPPSAAGEIRFNSSAVAGWTGARESSADLRFSDPRERRFGPMPSRHGRYEGVYLHGDRVVLAYTAHEGEIHESPWYLEDEKSSAFVRDIRVEGQTSTLSALLFDGVGDAALQEHGPLQIVRTENDGTVTVAAIHENPGAKLKTSGGQAALELDPHDEARTVRVLIWQGKADQLEGFLTFAEANAEPEDLSRLLEPGGLRWGEPLTTTGQRGSSNGPYAVDLIRAPLNNPFGAVLHFTGVDFLADGRAVVTTMHGDVWKVNGIDESLEKLSWRRFATGLNQPFGVRVVDGKIYVACEDELTILHDRNGDGEADYYESFTNLIAPGAGAWRQAFGLEVDKEGYFYFARGRGRWGSEYRHGVIRVSPDGKQMEVIATGFRQPWAIGLSPEGRITVSQQEGPWVPQTPVHKIDTETRQGSFYGHTPDRRQEDEDYPRPLGYEPPILWMPRHVDNSGAGQAWVESDDWGLPRGTMLHFSGAARLMQLFHEQVNGDRQGGVVPLVRLRMWRPRTGRFHEADGQLYAVGLYPEGSLERVRHTGTNVHVPIALHAHANGVRIRFNHPVSPGAAEVTNYTIHRWNYRWTEKYGSDFYSVENPGQLGQDPVELNTATLLNDGREVFLEIPDMKPAMQMRISYELEAADGTPMKEDIYSTIHALAPVWER